MATNKNTEGTIAVDKEELSRIIKEAVRKRLSEAKFKPFTKKDDKPSAKGEKTEKNNKSDKKEDKKEMSDFMKKKLREAVKTVLEALDLGGDAMSPDSLLQWMQSLPEPELKTLKRVKYSQGDDAAVKVMRRIDPSTFEGTSDEEILQAAMEIDFDTMSVVVAETGMPPMGAQGAMAPTMEAGKPTIADPHAAEELMLYLENDYELWMGNQKKSIEKNLAQKMKKGRYDSALAPKIWMYLADAAATKYIKDHGTPGDRIDSVFNKATRMQVADRLAKQFEGEVKTGEKDLDSLLDAI